MAASRSAKPHSSRRPPAPAPALPGAFAPGTARGTGSGRSGTATPAAGSPPGTGRWSQCPEEGLLGHLLRRVGVPAEGQDVAVHVGEIRLIDLLKIRHGLTSLSAIGRMDSSFVTKKCPGFRALFYGSFLRHSSTGNIAPQMWQYMILLPSGLHLDDRKSCPDNSAPQEGHTNTVAYRRLHRTSPTAPATTAATPRGHRSVPAAIIPPNRSTHQITKPPTSSIRPCTHLLVFSLAPLYNGGQ